MQLKRRWLGFCRRAGATGRQEEAFAELDRRYREPGRYYHDWAHVAFSLRELRRAGSLGEPVALELAIWFHDAVYEPGRADNEERSAELARRWSSALGLPAELGGRAAALVLATSHAQSVPPREDSAEALLVDIDLAVLGAGRVRYLRYERGIAREHSAIPPARFREGRVRLLRGLLARPAIFLTPGFRRRLERRARGNLARALRRLDGPTRREARR